MYTENSEEFQEKIVQSGRKFKSKLEVNGTSIESGIKKIKYVGGSISGKNISIGNTVSARIEVEMEVPDMMIENQKIITSLQMETSTGYESIQIGVFYPQSPKATGNVVKFTAADIMSTKAEKLYVSELTYPVAAKSVLEEICKYLEISLATENLQEIIMDTKPEGYSYREVIGYVAGLMGCFACINRFGNLEIRWFEDNGYEVSYKQLLLPTVSEKDINVGFIKCVVNDETTYTVGSGIIGIQIENPFMTETILNTVYEKISGFTYRPSEVSMLLYDMRLEPWDIVTIKELNVKVPCMTLEYTFDGGVSGKIKAIGESEAEAEINYQGPMAKKMQRFTTELMLVNKLLVNKLDAETADIKYLRADEMEAVVAELEKAVINDLSVEFADVHLSNIDIADIGQFFADSGIVTNMSIVEGKVTGVLDSVTINANSITSGTLTTDRLVIRGVEHSIVYELNNITGALQSVDVDTLNGEIITDRTINADKLIANSITANEINVADLVSDKAFINAISTNSIVVGASNNAAAALNAANNVCPFITGTQTAATGAWTGEAPFEELVDGQQITYWLPYAGNGNASLELTLPDGTTTGAIACYYGGGTRLTTHYPAGSAIRLTYRSGGNINNGSYTGWWADANYDSGNTYDRIRYLGAIKAASDISAWNIIVGDSRGYHNLKTGGSFDVGYPILYAGNAISSGSTSTNMYIVMSASIAYTQSLTLTAYKSLYIKGTLNGSIFTPISTAPITQSIPTTEDGYSYILLGTAYSSTAFYLLAEHPIFQFINGCFQQVGAGAYNVIDEWSVVSGGTTYINGANIYTGSITAEQIAAGAITAEKLSVDDLSAICAKIGKLLIDENGVLTTSVSISDEVVEEDTIVFDDMDNYINIEYSYSATHLESLKNVVGTTSLGISDMSFSKENTYANPDTTYALQTGGYTFPIVSDVAKVSYSQAGISYNKTFNGYIDGLGSYSDDVSGSIEFIDVLAGKDIWARCNINFKYTAVNALEVGGDLTVEGATILNSTLRTTGATTLSSTLYVTGNTTHKGNVYLANGTTYYLSSGGSAVLNSISAANGITSSLLTYAGTLNIGTNSSTTMINQRVGDYQLRFNGTELYHCTSSAGVSGECNIGSSSYRFNAIYAKSMNLSSALNVAGAVTATAGMTVSGGSLSAKAGFELFHSTPFIDFHYGNSTADYTSRIIENASGTLAFYSNVVPGANQTKSLGTSSLKWANTYTYMLYYTAQSQSSDKRLKKDIADIDDRYLELWDLINPQQFKFIEQDKTSLGIIAQELEESMLKVGLTEKDCGFLNKQWIETEEYTGYEYGVDYTFINILTCKKLKQLIARIELLEKQLNG